MIGTGAGPRWTIEELLPLVPGAHIPHGARSAVIAVLACNDQDARKYIRSALRQLTVESFYERHVYKNRNPQGRLDQADVYQVRDTVTDPERTLVWYVKICVRDGVLVVDSFHEPERPMK